LRITQEELAERMGVARVTVAKVETDNQIPSRRFLETLHRLYRLSMDWVLTGAGDPLVGTLDEGGREARYLARHGIGAGLGVGESGVGSKWSYAELRSAEEIQIHASLDAGLRGTNLERLVFDGPIWGKMQPVTGAEFERLREYCDAAGDPPGVHYLAVLEFLRKVRV
jgi:transcriptional regulator with XRE-family HTH domain